MPRPKGSRNKKSIPNNIDEQLSAITAEIEALSAQLKEKKAEQKKLLKARAEADRLAAKKKAEEDRKMILEAVQSSGKSVEEILEFLK